MQLTEYDSVWRRRQPVDTFIANEYGNCHNTFSESSSEPTSIMGWYWSICMILGPQGVVFFASSQSWNTFRESLIKLRNRNNLNAYSWHTFSLANSVPSNSQRKDSFTFWWGSYETNSIDFHCQWDKDISKLMLVLAGGWHFFSLDRWVWTVASGDHHDALWENKWSFCRGESEVWGNNISDGIVSNLDALVWGVLYKRQKALTKKQELFLYFPRGSTLYDPR